jgi:hypothetical protein
MDVIAALFNQEALAALTVAFGPAAVFFAPTWKIRRLVDEADAEAARQSQLPEV